MRKHFHNNDSRTLEQIASGSVTISITFLLKPVRQMSVKTGLATVWSCLAAQEKY